MPFDFFYLIDVICKLICEGQIAKIVVKPDTVKPHFNSDILFYIKDPSQYVIEIEVSLVHNVNYWLV